MRDQITAEESQNRTQEIETKPTTRDSSETQEEIATTLQTPMGHSMWDKFTNLLTRKKSPEKLKTTGTLKSEIKKLVKERRLNNYPYSAIKYLRNIYEENAIFTERNEAERVAFLERVKEFLEDPQKLGVDIGKEISQ